MPGDALTAMLSPDTIVNSTIDFETLKAQLGLDQPLYKQYIRWIGNLFQGDFGRSFVDGLPIGEKIAIHLPGTLELMGVSILIAGILGISLGFLSAIKQNTWLDYTNTTFGMIGISIPEFFFGMGAILIFAIKLRWFPTGGNLPVMGEQTLGTFIKHITLPALVLGLGLIAALMRQVRGSMIDVLNNDYIKTARSKGISEFRVYTRHAFRNAFTPVMLLLIFRLPMLVAGSIVTETVFSWNGMGQLILQGVRSKDYPVVMMTTLMIGVLILTASFLSDVFTAMLDPRVRLEKN